MQGKKGWARWVPKSAKERQSPRSKFDVRRVLEPGLTADRKGELESLQERLEVAAALEATTTATRNKNKFLIKEMTAATCRNPVLRNELMQKTRKARKEFDARVGALPRGKTVQRSVVPRFGIIGKASEVREEGMGEEQTHCERCHDDKDETSQMQEARVQAQRPRGDSFEAWPGRTAEITVDSVLRAWEDEEQGQWSE